MEMSKYYKLGLLKKKEKKLVMSGHSGSRL